MRRLALLFSTLAVAACSPAPTPAPSPLPEVKSLDYYVKNKPETEAILKRCAVLPKPADDQNCTNAEQASIAHTAKPLGTTEFTKKKH
jgi:hypothetical protein